MKIMQPILDRVVVRPEIKENVADSGIILPDESSYAYVHPLRDGTVVAVGSGKLSSSGESIPMTVKVGDRVCFAGHAGISIDGEEGKKTKQKDTLLTEDDIYFIYEETNIES